MTNREIVLSGLIGSRPIGAMAAFGTLRLCETIPDLEGTALNWALEDDWLAVLHVPQDMDETEFIQLLGLPQNLKHKGEENGFEKLPPWLQWADDLRVKPELFREYASQSLMSASYADREFADFMAAYGSEVFLDGNKNLAPTFFHMTSGQQRFLDSLSAIALSLNLEESSTSANLVTESFRQALFGPWLYEDEEHSMGWDSDQERMHALRFREPSKDKSNKSVKAAVWLAFQSLPLFPTSPGLRRIQTSGFSKNGRTSLLRWPVWRKPIHLSTLKSLLVSSELHGSRESLKKLKRRGVDAVFESKRHTFGKGYGIFRPAESLPL